MPERGGMARTTPPRWGNSVGWFGRGRARLLEPLGSHTTFCSHAHVFSSSPILERIPIKDTCAISLAGAMRTCRKTIPRLQFAFVNVKVSVTAACTKIDTGRKVLPETVIGARAWRAMVCVTVPVNVVGAPFAMAARGKYFEVRH
jgi:hypothetical protein